MGTWKKAIYLKIPRFDLTFWYGGNGIKGKKEEMTEEEKENNNRIMKEPIMKEELVWIINKQRDGKAAVLDGIKAEMMKHLIKNKKIK